MPQWIDPAWEYWTPDDPEVAELLEEAARCRDPLARLGVELDRTEKRGGLTGVRLGRGDPDRFDPDRGRDPAPPVIGRRWLPKRRPCAGCRRPFKPDRSDRRYCSLGCVLAANVRGAKPRLPPSAACAACGRAFRPRSSASKYCSRACGGTAGGSAFAAACAARVEPEGFRAAYLAGEPMRDLSERLGVTEVTLRRLRKRLGIPARPSGRPRRAC